VGTGKDPNNFLSNWRIWMKFGMGILFNPVSSTIPKWRTLIFTKEKKQDEARPCV
jgi:hypothetical protein